MADRMYMVHLESGDTCGAQFNPTQVKEAIEVVWRRVEVRGESHEPMEYDHTKNIETSFELAFDRQSGRGIRFGGSLSGTQYYPDSGLVPNTQFVEDALIVKRWLMACCYPKRGAQTVRQSAPSRILVVWPGFYNLAMRLVKVEFTNTQWEATDGPPVAFTAMLTFEADASQRLFYEDVLAHGTERGEFLS